MKVIIISIVLLFTWHKSTAQFKFELDSLSISHIVDPCNPFMEGDWQGPYLHFYCKIIANVDTVYLFPLHDSIILSYNLKTKHIERRQIALSLSDRPIVVAPSDTIGFSFGDHIFLGTGALRSAPFDYSQLLIETLPTLKLEYRKTYLPSIICDKIRSVKVLNCNSTEDDSK